MTTSSGDNLFPTSADPMPGGSGSGNGSGYGSSSSGLDSASSAMASPSGDMLSRVVERAHATIDRLAETAAPHVHRLQEGASSAGGMLHSHADQAREMGDEWAQSLRGTVRENPLAAVAAALALGVIIAKLSR